MLLDLTFFLIRFIAKIKACLFMESKRLFWIDWLRFLAAFSVVFCHIRGGHFVEYGMLDPSSKNIVIFLFFAASRLGHEAVVLFFALSGMLVGGKLIERAVSGNLNLTSYFIDRFFRIYVPYFPILLISGLVASKSFDTQNFFVNLAGLQGVYGGVFVWNNSLWSLSYEIWFYILAGAAASFLLPKLPNFKIIGFLIIFILSISIYLKLDPVYFFCFFVSSFLNLLRLNSLYRYPLLICSVVVCFLLCAISQVSSDSKSIELGFFKNILPDRNTLTIILCVGFCVLIKAVSMFAPQLYFSKVVEKIGVIAASFSYSLYLSHLPAIYFLTSIGAFSSEKLNVVDFYSVIVMFCKILSVFVVSYILYYLFERNTGYLKNQFKYAFSIR
jgi:peptidoglycan/LPS O-acetylase OafA/YrhL